MEISFTNERLANLCNSENRLRGKYGPRMAALIQRRLFELSDAETLAVMRSLPGRCHELRHGLKGCLAVDLVHPKRLVFEPDHDPLPTKEDGGLDWEKVTKIVIIGIGDYHG